jgi:hypothetical protein
MNQKLNPILPLLNSENNMVNRIFYEEEFKEFRKILIYKREDIELCIHLCHLEHNNLFDRSINSFIKESEDRIYYLKGFYNEVDKLFKLDSPSIVTLVDDIIYDYYHNNKLIIMLQHLYAELEIISQIGVNNL